MTRSYFPERNLHLAAFERGKAAAWHERATWWQARKIGRLSGNWFESPILPINSRNRAQPPGVIRRAKVGGSVSVLWEPIYVRVISSVNIQAECNPPRIAKLRLFLQWMIACGLHVKPDLPIEGDAPCHLHGLLDGSDGRTG